MAVKTKKEQVKDEFWMLLVGANREHVGKLVKYELLTKRTKGVFGSARKLGWIQNTLRELNRERSAGTGISIVVRNETGAFARWGKTSLWDDRGNTRPELKERIGDVLWQVLFGVEINPGNAPEFTFAQKSSQLENKIVALRSKSPINVLVDAGTTTLACMREFLKLRSMPLEVNIPSKANGEDVHDSEQQWRKRACSLSVLTNSPPIQNAITESIHADDIPVVTIGGQLRPSRKSICGQLAQDCLRSWSFRGDLAIIGTTGYRMNYQGQPCFACDGLAEAQIKESLMELAWFRCLIFCSDKLASTDISKVFVPLSSGMIDLIITDDGVETDQVNRVQDFLNDAVRAQVPVVLVDTH